MALNDIYRVVIEGTVRQQTVLNTLAFQTTQIGTGSEMQALADNVAQVWDVVIQRLAPQLTYSRISVRGITDNTAGLDIPYTSSGGAGSEVGDTTTALVVSLKTGLIGKSYRGRNYLPAVPEGAINGSLIDAVTRSAVETAYANFRPLTDVGGYEFTHVIWSPTLGVMTPVQSAVCDEVPGTIRNRRIGSGS